LGAARLPRGLARPRRQPSQARDVEAAADVCRAQGEWGRAQGMRSPIPLGRRAHRGLDTGESSSASYSPGRGAALCRLVGAVFRRLDGDHGPTAALEEVVAAPHSPNVNGEIRLDGTANCPERLQIAPW
jgi:hypothetical protein